MPSLRDKFDASAARAAASPRSLRPGAFTSLFNAVPKSVHGVPASVRKMMQEGESSFRGVFLGSSRDSEFLYLLEEVEDVCCGKIGTAGKLCIRAISECDVSLHAKSKMKDVQPGLYLRSGGDAIYSSPFLSLQQFTLEELQKLMKRQFSSSREAEDCLESYKSHSMESDSKPEVKSEKPPPRKIRKISTMRSCYEEVATARDDGTALTLEDGSTTKEPDKMLDHLHLNFATRIDANTEDGLTLSDKLNDVDTQLGVPPTPGPPSLWVGYMALKGDYDELHATISKTAENGMEGKLDLLDTRLHTLDRELSKLQENTVDSFMLVETSINSIAGKNVFREQMGESSLADTPDHMNNMNEEQAILYDTLISRVDELSNRQDLLEKSDPSSNQVIKIGQFSFESMQDVAGWAAKYMPTAFPFGSFIDVYSYMMRVKSHSDVEDEKGLAKMEKRKNLKLTADEAIVVNSFEHPLPKGFHSGSSSASSELQHYWLPGLKKKVQWEDKSRLKGLKVMILKNMDGIRRRILSIINHRLKGHAEASSLCRELLSDTLGFMSALCSFISDTNEELTRVGFAETDAWELVSKLIHRMFAEDCYQKRGIVAEMLDSTDHSSLGAGLLWGTFATHQVLREYQKYGIANHPSIASEYVRFLVNNCGTSKLDSMEKRCIKMERSVEDIKSIVESVQKKVDSLSNKADDAKRKADEALRVAKAAKN